MISLVLVGAQGRMGNAIEIAAATADDLRIKARVERNGGNPGGSAGPGHAAAGYRPQSAPADPGPAMVSIEELPNLLGAGDVVIEFSSPEGSARSAEACAARSAGLVSGTTGLAPAEEAALVSASRQVAVLRAANFSLGVLALRRALAAALDALPESWDIEIIERHHRRKVDAPSGTALMLAREAAGRRGLGDAALRFGREGRTGPRGAEEIGIHSLRGGTWVGDHEVLLAGEGEWLEVRHVAEDRAAFAHGAIAAARFVAQAPPGLYALEDVLATPRRTA